MKKLFLAFLILLLPALVMAQASQKVVDMTAITSPASTDLLYVVANPGTTPVDRKLTFGNLAISLGGNTIGATGSRVTKGWFTDLEVTNPPSINGTAVSANGVSLITAANYAAMRTLMGVQASLGFTAVANSVTVNGHALSSNVTVSASDLTTGTLPHAQLPTLLTGDIPANAANTSGTAGGLSGTPALPNGTTATKQAVDDNTTKIATDSFVMAQRGRDQAEYDNGTCTTAKTISAANGPWQKMTLTDTDTCALTFTQPTAGTMLVHVRIVQSASGAFSGGISGGLWQNGVTPTITQTSGAVDFISCYLNGTSAYCNAGQDYR